MTSIPMSPWLNFVARTNLKVLTMDMRSPRQLGCLSRRVPILHDRLADQPFETLLDFPSSVEQFIKAFERGIHGPKSQNESRCLIGICCAVCPSMRAPIEAFPLHLGLG